ncbi:unnamed protein product [Rotaria sordida]|uniref:Large ribosomal subunit protein mL42 n=1 Tax=Rotaria sordida TaxID=392033 RepID=A0A813QTH5_9BILA|nr:unnamed protein product [Rotaria sordida]CAF0794393.1 unnamed protein product [Rotaria sordida]CAF3528925.1 unnamed protein product [Rotaria sordida]
MYRIICRELLLRRISTTISAFASSDVNVNLPNPCIAMAPDTNHIVCYHPEKPHPYEYTKPIDRNDPSFTKNEGVFKSQVQHDYNNRFYKKQLTKKDFRLETEQLSQMFNEHPALFKLTPKRDKIRRASQFPEPAPDRSGI